MVGLVSGHSVLLLADLVKPGVELGAVKKNILEKPSNPLRRTQEIQQRMQFLSQRATFLPVPLEILIMLQFHIYCEAFCFHMTAMYCNIVLLTT